MADQSVPLPSNTKVVAFSKNEQGEFVDNKGKPVDKALLQTMFKTNSKGEFVDDKGKPVEKVEVMIEEQVEELEESQILSEDEEENELAELADRTAINPEDEAEEIALNKAMERMLKKFGEEALSVETIWQCFLDLLEEESFTKAFEVILRFGDDFFFLRACLMTGGKVIPKLHRRVGQRVLRKLCQIRLAGNLDMLGMHFIERGVKNNYIDRVDFQTNEAVVDALGAISLNFNNAVKERAEYLKDLVSKLITID